MLILARARLRCATTVVVCAVTAALVAGCATPQPKSMLNRKRSKEYFAESEYGVKASPRVAFGQSNLKRGGGRDQLGKPYKVRGRMYYPKEDKNYKKVGLASWYGDAFHGRLTANGEVYDMTHLTAAHPTMPLPSYARVTNTLNGNSVIVRVNDRGPYSNDRLIDLSKKAAELLDYTRTGTAKVKVEYVGRAPLEGHDDQYLLASYRPGNKAPDPSDGLPTGVMIAMNGPSPSAPVRALPSTFADAEEPISAEGYVADDGSDNGDLALPAFGPMVAERPDIGILPSGSPFAVASLSYAETAKSAVAAFAALDGQVPLAGGWKTGEAQSAVQPSPEPFVAAGSFTDRAEADRLAAILADFGKTEIETSHVDGADWYSVNLRSDGKGSIDDLLQAAWDHGASDAIAVRD